MTTDLIASDLLAEATRIGRLRELGAPDLGKVDAGLPRSLGEAALWACEPSLGLDRHPYAPVLFWLVEAVRPGRVLELATGGPTTGYFALCHAIERLALSAECVSIGHGGDAHADDPRNQRFTGFSRVWPELDALRSSLLPDGGVDLLYLDVVDGHSPELLSRIARKLSKRALVVIHGLETNAAPDAVAALWRQRTRQRPHFVFPMAPGLGLVSTAPRAPAGLEALFDGGERQAHLLRRFFARLATPAAAVAPPLQPRREQPMEATPATVDADALLAAVADQLRQLAADAGQDSAQAAALAVAAAQLSRSLEEVGGAVADLGAGAGPMAVLGGLTRAVARPVVLRLAARPRRLREYLMLSARPGMVDREWYLKAYPDVAGKTRDPALHYVLFGAEERRRPNRWFDTAWYLASYPDVAAAGVNPLLHFLQAGRREGRAPSGALPEARRHLQEVLAARPGAHRPLAPRLTALEQGLRRGVGDLAALDRRQGLASMVETAQVEPTPAKPESKSLRTILFVKNDSDLMTHQYRIHNYADALTPLGYECLIRHYGDVPLAEVGHADVLVLCRLASTVDVQALIDHFRAAGRPVVFDVDDLVFDPARIDLIRHVKHTPETARAQALSVLERNRRTLLACDFVTVSTFALKTEVEKLGKRAFVVPNTISERTAQSAAERAASVARRKGRVRIGYFSGTGTHEDDFEEVRAALHDLMAEREDVELLVMGELAAADEFGKYGARFLRRPLVPHADMLEALASVDVNLAPLELGNPFTNAKSELKVFEAALYGVPTIASPTSGYAGVIAQGRNGLLASSREEWLWGLRALVDDRDLRRRLGEAARATIAPRFMMASAREEMLAIYKSAVEGRLREPVRLPEAGGPPPSFTVVGVLYNKAGEVRHFLESLRRQSYPGAYEVLLIDDRSPDDSVEVVEAFWRLRRDLPDTNPGMSVRVLRNPANVGNCGSRNRALAESDGEVVVVVDADCMLNRDFLSEHAAAYMYGDCDAAFGPMNIETGERPPAGVRGLYEADPDQAELDAALQDPANPESFVNAITRNFSVRRGVVADRLDGRLFDEAFAYSARPDSGFGWEDVEMGWRLYAAGARFKFLPGTASIHVSHPPTSDARDKALRSLRNFRRLHDKHPDIRFAARQWGVRTYQAICDWARGDGARLEENDDFKALEEIYGRYRRAPIVVDRSRKLRVLTYRWHVPHQYELYKSGHAFTLVTGAGTGLCEAWEPDKRPMPRNARFRPVQEIDPRDYDLAILHFDENALHPELCHGKVPPDWGETLKYALANWPIPKVAICHGTPQFRGQYDRTYDRPDRGQVIEENRLEMVELLGDVPIVCNSHQARHEWGFRNAEVIWHGFAPHDYPVGPGDRGVLSMMRGGLTNRPWYNGLLIHDRVQELVGDAAQFEHLRTPDPEGPCYGPKNQAWATSRYQNYVREVARYSVYFNPTIRSPMPRSRGEAMAAGLVTVSLRNHDVDLFIRNGVNGFYADEPEELAEQIRFLLRDDGARRRMAEASRRTAIDLFNQDRYLAAWSALIQRVTA